MQQVKTIVDAGVRFVVHLGVFGNGKSTDPLYAWHELVERYIQGSGLAWCHLHANFFMENLLSFMPITDGAITWPTANREVGWIAGDDIAAVAARVLAQGPKSTRAKTISLERCRRRDDASLPVHGRLAEPRRLRRSVDAVGLDQERRRGSSISLQADIM